VCPEFRQDQRGSGRSQEGHVAATVRERARWRGCAFSIARLFARGNPHMTEAECAAYDAPFPGLEYRAATKAFPEMVPDHPDADGVAVSRQAAHFWVSEWQGPSILAVGEQDPVFTPAVMEALRQHIRNCPPPLSIPQGGHFVQEHGAVIAAEALRLLAVQGSAMP